MEKSMNELLNAPFRYEEYRVNYKGQVYVGVQSMVDRLNEVFTPLGWEFEPLKVEVNMETFIVSAYGQLRIFDADRIISRFQYGDDRMTILNEQSSPTAQAVEDSKKAAVSDSLKKCAAWIGVASDVYKGLIKYVPSLNKDKKENVLYSYLIDKYGLSRKEYEYGIPILPDSYKDYYQAKGWMGIFRCDIQPQKNDRTVNLTEKTSSKTGDSKTDSKTSKESEKISPRQASYIRKLAQEVSKTLDSDKKIIGVFAEFYQRTTQKSFSEPLDALENLPRTYAQDLIDYYASVKARRNVG